MISTWRLVGRASLVVYAHSLYTKEKTRSKILYCCVQSSDWRFAYISVYEVQGLCLQWGGYWMGISCGGRKRWLSVCHVQLNSSICICMCSLRDWGWWVRKKGCLNAKKARYSNAEGIWVMRELKKEKSSCIYLCLLITCRSVFFEL